LNEDREKQALVPIAVGDYISKSFEDQHGIALSLFKILEISSMSNEAVIIPVYRKSSLINDDDYPTEYKDMILTSISKLKGDIKVISQLKHEKEPA
jgi:hypothetical protein